MIATIDRSETAIARGDEEQRMIFHEASDPAEARASADPIARARALSPLIRSAASATEEHRRLEPAVVEALHRAGLFRMLVPRDLGGDELDPATACKAIEEVSAADGSTGWCVMIATQNQSFAGLVPPRAARAVWGEGGVVAGTIRPLGRMQRVTSPGDGYLVSGRWPIASGSSHATWFTGECVITGEDRPAANAPCPAETRFVLVPRAEVSIIETWDTLGLRGTASNDFVIDRAWVPAERTFSLGGEAPLHPWPFYRALALAFAPHGSHALGVARAAIETARALAATKPAAGAPGKLAEQPRFQLALAEAVAARESARAFLYAAMDACWQSALAGRDEPTLRSRVRLAASHAVLSSVRAVDQMHAAVGTAGIHAANPIERCFRDIHTAAAHVMVGPVTLEAAGRVELGLEARFPFF